MIRPLAYLIILAGAASQGMAAPIGNVINFSGQFGRLDLGTGVFTPVGAGIPNTPDGIAGAPGGPFFTVDGVTGHLLRIAPGGVVTDVGDTGTGPNEGPKGVSVIGSLTTGALYALDFSNRLFSINASTGALSLRGTLALPTQEDAYIGNMTTSLNGNGASLFYTLEIFGGPNMTGPTLFQIDPLTLQITSKPLLNEPGPLIGSGFVGGVLYGFSVFGDIVTINTSTGVTTLVGHYDSGATADNPGPPFTGIFGVIAPINTPEPDTLLISACGLLLIGIGRAARRR